MTPQQAFQLWLFPYLSTALVISLVAVAYLGNQLRQLHRNSPVGDLPQ
jgi:hypothetical protein